MKMGINCQIIVANETELKDRLEYLETNYDTRIGRLNATDQLISLGLNSDSVTEAITAIQDLRSQYGTDFSWSGAMKISDVQTP